MFEDLEPVEPDVDILNGESADVRYVDLTERYPVVREKGCGRQYLATSDIYSCGSFGVWDDRNEIAALSHFGVSDVEWYGNPHVTDVLFRLPDRSVLDVRLLTGPSTDEELVKKTVESFNQAPEETSFSSMVHWKVDPSDLGIEGGMAISLQTGDFYLYHPSADDEIASPFDEENFSFYVEE